MKQATMFLLTALAAFVPAGLFSQSIESGGRAVLYAAVGSRLTAYELDQANGVLIERGSVVLPANVQEAWQHPSHKYLYVAWSNGGASYASAGVTPKGDQHGISAFRIDPASGALVPLGRSAPLPSRPIFITTDLDGTHVLTAHNDPSGLTVHRILPDGTVGDVVAPAAPLGAGIYGHQVRVDPSNRAVILVTRGNGPTATKPEDPGALKLFRYNGGVLANWLSIAPGGGFNYQVRHLDFHPSGKWVYVTLERQNQIHVYRRMADGGLSTTTLFVKDTLMQPAEKRAGQAVASIHVHPNGRFIYAANRATGTVEFEGQRVFGGGENTIAVFAINPQTGEPALIQSMDTRGFQPRTFALDRSGRFLAVANQSPMLVRENDRVRLVPASVTLFRVKEDGKLAFAQQLEIKTDPRANLFWAGFLALP